MLKWDTIVHPCQRIDCSTCKTGVTLAKNMLSIKIMYGAKPWISSNRKINMRFKTDVGHIETDVVNILEAW